MQKTDSGQSAASSSISLPSGGGAVKGMGESFAPDLFTGTGNFSVPIALPAGRNGFQPQMTLVYSSGNGNGAFGLGWNLSIPGVSRKTSRGIPLYDESKDVFLLSGAEDLVLVEELAGVKRYRPRTEGLFARIERHLDAHNDYWKVWSKDGLISYYGTPNKINTPDRYNDPATIANPAYKSSVFEWKLSKTEDVFGNVIVYSYKRIGRVSGTPNSDPHDGDMLYLERVQYADYKDGGDTKFLCSVKFNYEDRPDPSSSYRSGFEIRHTLRCQRIELYTHPEDTDTLTKAYELIYLDKRVENKELDKKMLPANGASILSQVKIIGYDGSETESMPPLEFGYTTFNPVRRDFDPVRGKELPAMALSEGGYDLIDLDGNGLVDIVELGGVLPRYWKNLGNGVFDTPRTMNEAPAGIALGDPGVFLGDATGDGRPDLIVNKVGLNGYFSLNFNGQWDKKSFKPQTYAPSFSLQDPEVRLLDLDGDGITDVLRNGSRFECFFNDADQGFYKTTTINKKQVQDFPNISFSDQRLRFADMTGDGMQDMVLIYDGNISYWPNLGHGNWGKKVTMKHNPRFPYQYNSERIILGDIDGDGCCDLLFVEDNKVTLWINNNGESWSEASVINGTPPARDMKGVRLADLCGWGTSALVWSYAYDGSNRDRMFFLDFNGAVKPYVLNEMNNHMGAITRVEYRSSTYYYLSDRDGYDPFDVNNPVLPANRIRKVNGKDTTPPVPKRIEKKKWKTYLPFPVQVVAKTEVIDELSQGKLVTQYSYHHGYWDGGEREFRGFGNVIQRDTETFERYNSGSDAFSKVSKINYTPPLQTKSWFHLGPIGDEHGDWKEVDFTEEYWSEDPVLLKRPQDMNSLFKTLPRRARRDAYRTLRGSLLRSEVYALDGAARQNRPYTVSENLQGVRLEFTPSPLASSVSLSESVATNKQGSGYIFFSFGMASRTSQWERGTEPMTSFSFSEDYDTYGTPRKQMAIAVPRFKNPLNGSGSTEKYLCTYSENTFANRNNEKYLIGRNIQSASFEYDDDFMGSVFQLKELVLATVNAYAFPYTGHHLKLLSHSFTYYDGEPGEEFVGRSYGLLGDYGVAVRSETLAFDDALLTSIYGSGSEPVYVKNASPTWPAEYPSGFKTDFPTRAGYTYYGSAGVHIQYGYYCVGNRSKFDFHVDPATAKGLPLQSKDPLDHVTTIAYDDYTLFPVTVTDALSMVTEAEYDYRVMQAKQVTDPNGNRSQVAFSPLGFVIKTAVMGKSAGPSQGDELDHPGTLMEYDFFAYYNNKQPVFVKSTAHEGHYHSGSGGGEYAKTIVSVQYSDGFGRLIQSRSQAEEVIFGDPLYGDAGLAESSEDPDGDAIGTENTDEEHLNVLVSGWQVYNNKGAVVEKYEPYYDKGFDFDYPFISLQTASTWMNFTGAGIVNFPDQPQYHVGTGPFTLEVWIRLTESISAVQTIAGNMSYYTATPAFNGFDLYIQNNKIVFDVASESAYSSIQEVYALPLHTWLHVVVQKFDAPDDYVLYLNGEEESANVYSSNIGSIDDDPYIEYFSIGALYTAGESFTEKFVGDISQVRFYNRRLNEEEIRANYVVGRDKDPAVTDGLVLHVPLNDYNSGVILDRTPYGNSGFMRGSGMTWQQQRASQKVQLFYDPRGQVIRTVNPDKTEQRVLFGVPLALSNPNVYTPTPWESYTYDANDLGELTHPSDTTVPVGHNYTPSSSVIDALGRTVKTIDRNFKSAAIEEIEMKYAFDIRGNLLTVKDPYDRDVFVHVYDLLNRPLKTTHLDAGTKIMVVNCMSRPLEARDAKGSLVLNAYDELNRPTKVWCRDESSASTTLRHYTLYGDSDGPASPEDYNLKGKPYKQYDEAGLTTISSYDFKGNPLEKTRKVIEDSELLSIFSGFTTSWTPAAYRVDWDTSTDSILDSQEFSTTIEYDALNRVTKLTYPLDVESERKELIPSYNKSGALESVVMDGDPYVDRIAYNAKGQRILLAMGNGIMTRYEYRDDNFRLLRMKSEKYEKEIIGSNIFYEKQSGTVRQNFTYRYDLAGNIVSIVNEVAGCGVAGADELEREFEYDALYRLLSATGRETAPTATYPWDDTYRPENNGASRAYTQTYDYDKLGNIQSLQHVATSGNFTRTFNYVSGKNKIENIEIGSDTYDFFHDVNGNIESEGDTARKLTYDYADRLKSFAIQTGTAEPSKYAQYLYDAGGNRVKKFVRRQGGGYSVTVYIDGIFEYRKESDYEEVIDEGTGEQNTLHLMDGNSRLATRRLGHHLGDSTPEIKYNLEDHLGSSNLSLDTDGAVVSSEEYYPFGETSFGSYGKKRYRFCGKERDEESGLYYYGMRYYSPWTCRFISIDPLAAKYPFYSPYQYAGNRPVNFVDLDGMEPTINSTTHSHKEEPVASPKQNSNVEVKQDSSAVGNKPETVPQEKVNGSESKKTDEKPKGTANGKFEEVKDTNYGNYKVASGDTVSGIAKKYGDSNKTLKENIDLIKRVNQLDADAKIKVGERLIITNESKSVGGDYPVTEKKSEPMPTVSFKLEDAVAKMSPVPGTDPLESWGGPAKLGGKAGYEASIETPIGSASGQAEFTESGEGVMNNTKNTVTITPPKSKKGSTISAGTYMEIPLKGNWPSFKRSFTGGEIKLEKNTLKFKLGIKYEL